MRRGLDRDLDHGHGPDLVRDLAFLPILRTPPRQPT
jgi:hypothetical protein